MVTEAKWNSSIHIRLYILDENNLVAIRRLLNANFCFQTKHCTWFDEMVAIFCKVQSCILMYTICDSCYSQMVQLSLAYRFEHSYSQVHLWRVLVVNMCEGQELSVLNAKLVSVPFFQIKKYKPHEDCNPLKMLLEHKSCLFTLTCACLEVASDINFAFCWTNEPIGFWLRAQCIGLLVNVRCNFGYHGGHGSWTSEVPVVRMHYTSPA
jgi:hypothetical protein